MTSPVFRRAGEHDLDRLIEIHTSAFPDPRGHAARRLNFVENPLGALDDLRVAEVDGTPVAHAFLFPLTLTVGGAALQAGGIASVGVAPEARGTGVAAALLAHLHDEARARGDAVTVLYAFRQGFYARHGYAPASSYKRLRFHPRAVPRAWRAGGADAPVARVRAARGEDREAITALHAQAARAHTGWIARTERFWDARLLDEQRRWFVVEEGGAISGYVVWSLTQAEAHARTTLTLHELVAKTARAKRQLYALAGGQRDQVEEIAIDVPADDPIEHALVDMDRGRPGTADVEHTLGEIVAGPMVRLVDVPRALEARGYASDGVVTVSLRDTRESFRITVAGGSATVDPIPYGSTTALLLDRAALGAIAMGGSSPSDAVRLGWAEPWAESTGSSAVFEDAVALADRVFRIPPYFSFDPF